MTEQQHDILNRYEEALRTTLVKRLTDAKWLEGQLLEVEELGEKCRSSAPSYMADAVPEIAKYPLVAIAWAMYLGMGAATLWDKEWNRYKDIEDFHTLMFTRHMPGFLDKEAEGRRRSRPQSCSWMGVGSSHLRTFSRYKGMQTCGRKD